MGTPLTEEQKKHGMVLEFLEVRELLEETEEKLGLKVLAGEGWLDRKIKGRQIHRPGLALVNYFEHFDSSRIQILGNTECAYLEHLSSEDRSSTLSRLMAKEIPCIILTTGNSAVPEMIDEANLSRIPILGTDLSTTDLTHLLSSYLDDRFAPYISAHGSLVDVYGTGILFTGRSGIGKSEIALDLVERGHRLVADDVVHVVKKAEGILIGSSPEMIRHLIEIRGVGLVDVRRMFGIRAIRMQKRVEVEIRLQDWDDSMDWERIGLDHETTTVLGVDIPLIRLPIFPGKNISMVAEVIALNVHLNVYGFNAAQELNQRMLEQIDKKRIRQYLIKDFE